MKTLKLSILLVVLSFCTMAQNAITIDVSKLEASINPNMYGVFFEDINFAADGGLLAELIKNKSFEFTDPLMGWNEINKKDSIGNLLINNRFEKGKANPRFLEILKLSNTEYGISNEGFRGIGIVKDNQYHFSIWARQSATSKVKLRIEIKNTKGETIGNATLIPNGNEWNKYKVSFIATGTDARSKLFLWFDGKGKVDIDLVSLFPQNTWKQRPEGLRADLVQLLADMKPGFLRFPGGCIVEGRDLNNRYQWKKTIGNVDERELIVNRWNTEFGHKLAPDYFQSFGLGFFEYFQLSEDIGAEPLPILNCGMACQYNSKEVVAIDQLDPFVQDALDLIEFANGSAETTWGKLRTAMGHPAPFNLKLLGVGNEQWGPQYLERHIIFTKVIKDKYPDIKIISSVGPSPSGETFDFLNTALRKLNANILDEHYYAKPEWFLENAKRYDNYDRKASKIFAGEYAAQSINTCDPNNKNTWKTALAEAAFMTGLERNADVVTMASYAPLFAHTEAWQWTPDLIWFDNLKSYGSPNYYVQKLFSTNKGSYTVPMLLGNEVIASQQGLYGTASVNKNTNELIIKLVNTSEIRQEKEIQVAGIKKIAKNGVLTVMKNGDLEKQNSMERPMEISPKVEPFTAKGNKIEVKLAPYSFSIFTIKLN